MSETTSPQPSTPHRRRWPWAIAVLFGVLLLLGAIPTAVRTWTFRSLKGTTAQHVIAQCGEPNMVSVHASSRWSAAVPEPGVYPWARLKASDRELVLGSKAFTLFYPATFGETARIRIRDGFVESIDYRSK